MSAVIAIGELIVRRPELRGGRPCIAGTGVSVRRIVGWYKLGLTPEEIAERVGHLSLAQVHAALAYYHANRSEIEADITAEYAEAERLARLIAADRRRIREDSSVLFDEDSMDKSVVQALRARNVDVITALDADLVEADDERQLDFATSQQRVLYSFNAGDFYHLHTIRLTQDRANRMRVLSSRSNNIIRSASKCAVCSD